MNNTKERNITEYADDKNELNVSVDTIVVNEIGQFGKFQLRALGLAAIIAIFASWSTLEYVFTTARISSRCRIPECDSPLPEWSPDWLPNAIPATSSGSFDNCHRYGNTSAVLQSNTCPSTFFDTNMIQPCEEYVYENTHTVVYDFELACDEWSRALIGTVRTIGVLIALPITGYVSDRWGRRVALTLSAFNTGWIGVSRYWSNTYISYTLSQVFESTLGSGCFSSNYILLVEMMGPKYRDVGAAALNTCSAIGEVLLGFIAWGVPNWRNLTLSLYVPQLLTIFYFWLISESVRWYMSKGRFEDAERVLKKAAKINGRQLADNTLQALRNTALAKFKVIEDKPTHQEPWLIVQVFQHKRILLRCIITPIWFITDTLLFNGLSLNAVNMSGNSYLNFIAVAAFEIPGYWVAVILLKQIGRKAVVIGAFWVCGACQIAYIFIPKDLYAVSLMANMVSKCASAVVMTSAYIYTTELYPTKYRHSLFAYSSLIGKIGSMLAPLTPAFGAQWFEEFPYVLFASFALLSGALAFLTPETRNIKLPDTFEEASEIGLKNNNTNQVSEN